MTALVLVARLTLATAFLVSAVAKLADRSGSRRSVVAFGVPKSLAGTVSDLLPLLELAVAVALLPAVSAFGGAIGGIALLVLFSAAIALNLARGRRPNCHCFGQLSSEPIGWSTLLRNVGLIAVAALVAIIGRHHGQISALAWLYPLSAMKTAALVVSVIAVGLAGITISVLLQLRAQHGRIFQTLDEIERRLATASGATLHDGQTATTFDAAPPLRVGLTPGSPAPPFDLKGLHGDRFTLETLRSAGRAVLLLFADPECGACSALMPQVGRWQRELASALSITVISRGDLAGNQAKRDEYGLTQVLLQEGLEVAEAYQVGGSPMAVLVRADGTIGSYVAQGAREIRALVSHHFVAEELESPDSARAPCPDCGHVQSAASDPPASQASGLPLGTPVPSLRLPDLTGNQLDIARFRGRETLVVFWNPDCGFCQRILPRLKDWEQNRSEEAPALLLFSAGTAEANRAQGFRATIVLDGTFSAGRAFGASGTPSSVLVSADGRIASSLRVGGLAVMALADGAAAGP